MVSENAYQEIIASVYLMTTSVHLVFSQCTCSRCKMLYASVLRFRAFRTWAFLSDNALLKLLHNLHTYETAIVKIWSEDVCISITCRDPLFCLRQRSLWLVALPNGISPRSCVSQTGFSDRTASRAALEIVCKKTKHIFYISSHEMSYIISSFPLCATKPKCNNYIFGHSWL